MLLPFIYSLVVSRKVFTTSLHISKHNLSLESIHLYILLPSDKRVSSGDSGGFLATAGSQGALAESQGQTNYSRNRNRNLLSGTCEKQRLR